MPSATTRRTKRLAVVAVVAVCAVAPAQPAGAVSSGSAPTLGSAPPGKHISAQKHHRKRRRVVVPAVAPSFGTIIICNHTGHLYQVYADGPSFHTDDLLKHECTDWPAVLTGQYTVGFGLRGKSDLDPGIESRFNREGHVYEKTFNREGQISGSVGAGEVMLVELFIGQA
jgi:hypothetical protein